MNDFNRNLYQTQHAFRDIHVTIVKNHHSPAGILCYGGYRSISF